MDKQQRAQGHAMVDRIAAPILVVDDDYHLRRTIQLMLEEEQFDVLTAGDGREAVAQALARQPALIILDMGLPLLDGSEVAAQVRARYGAAVPVVLITADGLAAEKSHQIGAVSYLRKPFDFDDLIHVVQQALEQ